MARLEVICSRCGAVVAKDRKGQWANARTLAYRCLEVGKFHKPIELVGRNDEEGFYKDVTDGVDHA